MARFLVHGLVVETGSSLGFDSGAELLGGYPAAPVGSAPALVIQVDGAGSGGDGEGWWRHGPAEGAETILLQKAERVVLDADAIRVEAPSFAARVMLAGNRVEARVLDAAIDRHALAHVDLFLAFAAALRLHGRYHLHAACTVAPDGGALLIPGQGGSGKSTLASALIASGHGYLGDDVVFLDGSARRLLAFPRLFHLAPASAGAIPGLTPHLDGTYGLTAKQALDARAAFPGREVTESGSPRALLFPRVGSAAVTTLERLAPVDAAADLIESSAFVAARLPGHQRHLAALSALADAAPAWRVTLGRDLLEDAVGAARRVASAV